MTSLPVSKGERMRPLGSYDVAVIGAGLGGLAVALRLQAAGLRVVVVEARARPGGRAYRFEHGGFRWDTGPTLVTVPSIFRDLWEASGARFDDDVELMPLRPYYRVIFGDGSVVDYGAEPDEEAVASLSPEDSKRVAAFFDWERRTAARAFDQFARQPFLRMRDFVAVIPDLLRVRAYRSVYGLAREHFRDERVRALFSFHPLFIGGNPLRCSAAYGIVPYLERVEGVWYPRGGTYRIVEALERRFRALGGELWLGTPVRAVTVEDGRCTGIALERGAVRAKAVVSNADSPTTYLELLPARARPTLWRWRLPRMRYSMGCFILYLGLGRKLPDVVHHTIVMPNDYERALREVFDGRGLPGDIALYVHTPSRTDPTVAPDGHETMYVLVPVPHEGRGIEWTRAARPFRDRVLERLSRVPGFEQIEGSIVVERSLTPRDFASELRAYRGAAFSLEPTLLQSAVFRPHNRTEIPGLYLVGAGTHPGAGMPGVLLSAEITAALVLADLGEPPAFARERPSIRSRAQARR